MPTEVVSPSISDQIPKTSVRPDRPLLGANGPTVRSVPQIAQRRFYVAGTTILVVLCSFYLLPLWLHMKVVWADPLRSIGQCFPFISLLGVLAAWRKLSWRSEGSYWGLLLISMSLVLLRVLIIFSPTLNVAKQHLDLLPPGCVVLLYAIGAVLLFGGKPLLQRAALPLCLLLFINPVPHFYSSLVDMPLQEMSAKTARQFSYLIGLHPDGEQLRMMFAPNFGMMIVPGCDGVRGSITLAYLTVMYGYLRRMRLRSLVLCAAVAFAAGFAINLLRLCVLVIYYRLGVSVPSIRPYGAGVDYAIGCTLFLGATIFLGLLLRTLPSEPSSETKSEGHIIWKSAVMRSACLLAFGAVFALPQARSLPKLFAPSASLQPKLPTFPRQVGSYKLVRVEPEYLSGSLAMVLGKYESDYIDKGEARRLTLGLWVASPDHLVFESKRIQGVSPLWRAALSMPTKNNSPAEFVTSFYRQGSLQQFDAETNCSVTRCSLRPALDDSRLIFHIGTSRDLYRTSDKRLPILLREEGPSSDSGQVPLLWKEFQENARYFMSNLDTDRLVVDAGSNPWWG